MRGHLIASDGHRHTFRLTRCWAHVNSSLGLEIGGFETGLLFALSFKVPLPGGTSNGTCTGFSGMIHSNAKPVRAKLTLRRPGSISPPLVDSPSGRLHARSPLADTSASNVPDPQNFPRSRLLASCPYSSRRVVFRLELITPAAVALIKPWAISIGEAFSLRASPLRPA